MGQREAGEVGSWSAKIFLSLQSWIPPNGKTTAEQRHKRLPGSGPTSVFALRRAKIV